MASYDQFRITTPSRRVGGEGVVSSHVRMHDIDLLLLDEAS